MGGLDLFTLIIRRDTEPRYERYLRAKGIQTLISFPCLGTASQSILDSLGLDSAEKTLMMTFLERSAARKLMNGCVKELGIEVAGAGIAFLLPMDAVGGQRAMDALLAGQSYDLEEVKTVDKNAYPYALLVAILEAGNTDLVMDAAREAGARGGTVVHAKGTIGSMMRKFLGVTIAEEKEMILILTSQADKSALMKAIMEKAGIASSAHTILFSLPVDSIAGLRSIQAEDTSAEPEQ